MMEAYDLPRSVTISPCDCTTGGSNNQCFNFVHGMQATDTLKSFVLEFDYCFGGTVPTSLDVNLLTSDLTDGSIAFQLSLLPNQLNTFRQLSIEFEFGWPAFDTSVQDNQLCFVSSIAICLLRIEYQSKYLASFVNPSPFNVYSNLLCVSVNPITIGLTWLVFFDSFSFCWFDFLMIGILIYIIIVILKELLCGCDSKWILCGSGFGVWCYFD